MGSDISSSNHLHFKIFNTYLSVYIRNSERDLIHLN